MTRLTLFVLVVCFAITNFVSADEPFTRREDVLRQVDRNDLNRRPEKDSRPRHSSPSSTSELATAVGGSAASNS